MTQLDIKVYQNLSPIEFKRLMRAGTIRFAGNRKLKIYGQLRCASGKRMKKSNQVFFSSVEEAVSLGFRPCGRCMHQRYIEWRAMHTNP